LNADAICEKPLVIRAWHLGALQELEPASGRKAYAVLQLRLHPALSALKEQLPHTPNRERAKVELSCVTRRGVWYQHSWKGSYEKSGGLAMNIGIHFFDFLIWLFGDVEAMQVHVRQPDKLAGILQLAGADVRWFLSIDDQDLPADY